MCCRALGLNTSTYHARKNSKASERKEAEDQRIYGFLKEIIRENPGYGYRPLIKELKEEYNESIGRDRLLRLLGKYEVSLPRTVSKKKKSPIVRVLKECKGELDLIKGRDFGLLEAFSTDFTEIKYCGGKAILMAMVDVKGKVIPGWSLAPQRNRAMALKCWRSAKTFLSTYRKLSKNMIMHSDQDSVYTSYEWLETLLIEDGISVSYSENGSRENPWIEAVWSRLKDELGIRLTEAKSFEELENILSEWFKYYNERRRHSALAQEAPFTFLARNWKGYCLSLSGE